MNTMEIRGNFISLLAEVDDPELLKKMLEKCLEMLQTEDRLEDLSPELLAMLERAIEESYDESDLVPNEKVTQMARQWLKQ